jgi:hypothetical protein
LFFGRRRASALIVPWCTDTDPEAAHLGFAASEAEQRPSLETASIPLADGCATPA